MRYREILRLNENAPRVPDARGDDDENSQYDPSSDALGSPDLDAPRKPTLTLRMINRLKKIRSTKNLEMTKKQGLLGIMYGNGGDEEEI